eukprot:s1203_g5.t1
MVYLAFWEFLQTWRLGVRFGDRCPLWLILLLGTTAGISFNVVVWLQYNLFKYCTILDTISTGLSWAHFFFMWIVFVIPYVYEPNRIWFHRLPEDFVPPASQLPQDLLDTERTVSHHTFSVGYRAQCRFRSGPLFEHPAVARLDYLMSLDTDSMFTEDVETDPIEAMHQNKSLVLGYSHLMISNGAYMKGLWTATQPYLTYRGLKLAKLLQQNWHFLSRFLVPYVGHHTQERKLPEVMYSNLVVMTDLELLRISFFRPGSDYFRFYRYLDEMGGFWEHRWGDHAVRGLGAGIALLPHERDPSEASVAVPIGSVRLGG